MPRNRNKSRSGAMVSTIPIVKEIMVVSKRKRRNRRSKQSRGDNISAGALGFSKAYANLLNNPFDFEPMPIGLGTLIPTKVATAVLKGNFTVNATDGSFQFVLNPSLVSLFSPSATSGAFVAFDNSGFSTTPSYNVGAPNNRSAIVGSFDQLRVLAAGIRLFALQAQTAAPGILYAGNIAPGNSTTSNGLVPGSNPSAAGFTASIISNFPPMEMSKGYDPIQVVYRPAELSDYDFDTFDKSVTTVTNQVPVQVVVGSGFPATTVIYYDVVVHYEGYDSQVGGSAGPSYSQADNTAAGYGIPSVDSLFQRVKPFLSACKTGLDQLGQISQFSNTLLNSSFAHGLYPPHRHSHKGYAISKYGDIDMKSND